MLHQEEDPEMQGKKRQEPTSAATSGSYKSEPIMAHYLAGDVRNFTLLEHLDTGDPITTDLDQVIEEEHEIIDRTSREKTIKREIILGNEITDTRRNESAREASSSGSDLDKDDIITVKYLPLNLPPGKQNLGQFSVNKESKVSSCQ